MISLDDNNYDSDIKHINERLYTMNSYLTALTQISSLTYLTSLSTLTAYANDITSIKYDTFELSTNFNNYLLSSETSSLTFNSNVLSLSDYLKKSDSSGLTCEWKNIPTTTLNDYLLSSKTSDLTCDWKNIPTTTLNNYLLTSNYVSFDSSVLNNYLLTSNYVSFDSSVLNSYLLSSDYVSFDSSVLNSYLLSSDYVSFDSSVLNSYLLSSKTSDFAGSSLATISTLSILTSLSNTPYMIEADRDKKYQYNVSKMTYFIDGTAMGDYSLNGMMQAEVSGVWMNSYDHLLSLSDMSNCSFHFEWDDTSYHWSMNNRRIGFSGRRLYNNTFDKVSSVSAHILSSNKFTWVSNIKADYASSNTFSICANIDVGRFESNTINTYATNISFLSATNAVLGGVYNVQGGLASSCTFNNCPSVNLYLRAEKCSFTDGVYNLYMHSATSCSGYVNNCTINYAEKNWLTARRFYIGTASTCTFQTCDSIDFGVLYSPLMWSPHYVKGGTISGGSITGDNLVMEVGYINGLYIGNVCRGTISFTTMGTPFTIASAGYPMDIVISCGLHPYNESTGLTYYFSLSSNLSTSFTLHIYNIEHIRPSFQNATISNYLCLDVLGPKGVFSFNSYSYASLVNYCPTSRLSYNGIPWAAIQH